MMFSSLTEVLQARACGDKGITFIHSDQQEKVVTYKEMYEKACRVLYNLQARGMKPGDELVFQVENNEQFLYVFWACQLGKIIAVPITTGSQEEHKRKLFRIWNVLNNPYLVSDQERMDNIRSFAVQQELQGELQEIEKRALLMEEVLLGTSCGEVQIVGPEDIAFIQFSSGSTGDPKGVVLTHRNLLTNLNAIRIGVEFVEGDSALSWLPLTHDMGMIGGHMLPMYADGNLYSMETALFVRHPVLWLKKASQYRVNYLLSPNFGYKFFLNAFKPEKGEGWDLSSVKAVLNGAEPIHAELIEKFVAALAPFHLPSGAMFNVYGLAEASLAVTFPELGDGLIDLHVYRSSLRIGQSVHIATDVDDPKAVRIVDVGYPVTDCEVSIADEEGNLLGEDVVGCILIRGDNVTSGYYNNPEASGKLRFANGWLDTGDVGFLHNGRLFITGRAKEIIFVQGQNVYPYDIERVVADIEGISRGEVAACGVYNAVRHREEIIMFALFKRKTELFVLVAQEIKRTVSQRLGLTVEDVLPLKQIPKTTSGKIQRVKLAEEYRNGVYAELSQQLKALQVEELQEAADRTTEQVLLQISKEVLGTEEIGLHDSFTRFGCTSLQITKMHERLEQIYPERVKISDLYAYSTVSMLAELIDNREGILLPSVLMPETFFKINPSGTSIERLEAILNPELTEQLRQFADRERMDVSVVLLALCLHLISRVADHRQVTVQALVGPDERVRPVSVDFQQVTTLDELFHWVRNAVDAEPDGAPNLHDLQMVIVNKDPRAILPFFGSRDRMQASMNLIPPFDWVMEMFDEGQQLGVLFEYNGRRLSKDAINQFAGQWMKLVKLCVASLAQKS